MIEMNFVEMKGIVKQFPQVRAVDNVDFTLKKGEIHSLLGENGAGKSSLMKILYGMSKPDEGEIWINGKLTKISNPRHAIDIGIGMVHQHFMLAPVMTVAENVVVGAEPGKSVLFDKKAAERVVSDLIKKYGFNISACEKVSSLSVGEQQRVEILKAVFRGADILILDEPTAVLTYQEVEELFKIMRDLKAAGKSIIIITHKLKETLTIADRVSVMRDGAMIKSGLNVENVTAADLARMMVGRDVKLGICRRSEQVGDACFEIQNLSLNHKGKQILSDINLTVHKGEILGIAGVEGNGQTELIEILTGLRKADTLKLLKNGQEIGGNANDFIANHIGHIPEDRMSRGLIMDMSIADNVILGYHKKSQFASRGIFRKGDVTAYAQKKIEEFRIKAPAPNERCGNLSGGNQQKIVIARVFSQDPDVIIVAQPTRGVDIGAMEYIHTRLLDLRDEGKAIILISADLDEIRCLSDRLCVIYAGRIVVQTKPELMDEVELGLYMTGSSTGGGADCI